MANAPVLPESLLVLGEMDITDYKIDPVELESVYARIIDLLLAHGASLHIIAYDGRPLIDTFPARNYPNIHRVLSAGIAALSPPIA